MNEPQVILTGILHENGKEIKTIRIETIDASDDLAKRIISFTAKNIDLIVKA